MEIYYAIRTWHVITIITSYEMMYVNGKLQFTGCNKRCKESAKFNDFFNKRKKVAFYSPDLSDVSAVV